MKYILIETVRKLRLFYAPGDKSPGYRHTCRLKAANGPDFERKRSFSVRYGGLGFLQPWISIHGEIGSELPNVLLL
jgi:hypothetical protein